MAALQVFDDAVAIGGVGSDSVALGLHCIEDRDRAGRRVVADAIGDATVLVGVVGEDDRHLAFPSRFAAQPRPICGEVGDEVHAVRRLAIGHDAALGALVPQAVGLEGNGARHDATVEFGQHHVHGEVAGIESLRGVLPAVP